MKLAIWLSVLGMAVTICGAMLFHDLPLTICGGVMLFHDLPLIFDKVGARESWAVPTLALGAALIFVPWAVYGASVFVTLLLASFGGR